MPSIRPLRLKASEGALRRFQARKKAAPVVDTALTLVLPTGRKASASGANALAPCDHPVFCRPAATPLTVQRMR